MMANSEIAIVDLKAIYGETAKLADLPRYLERVLAQAGEGRRVILTGAAPVWQIGRAHV